MPARQARDGTQPAPWLRSSVVFPTPPFPATTWTRGEVKKRRGSTAKVWWKVGGGGKLLPMSRVRRLPLALSGALIMVAAIAGYLGGSGAAGAQNDGPPPGNPVEVVKVSGLLDEVLVDFVEDRIAVANEERLTAIVLQLNSSGATVSDERIVALARAIKASRGAGGRLGWPGGGPGERRSGAVDRHRQARRCDGWRKIGQGGPADPSGGRVRAGSGQAMRPDWRTPSCAVASTPSPSCAPSVWSIPRPSGIS